MAGEKLDFVFVQGNLDLNSVRHQGVAIGNSDLVRASMQGSDALA